MSVSYLINAFFGSKTPASITTTNPTNGWRWGYGIFAILMPCAIAPVVGILGWGERRAQKLGLVKVEPAALTLSAGANGGWSSPSIIAMIVLGALVVIGFAAYEIIVSKFPVIPGHMIRNEAVMAASPIGVFDFASFYLTFLYLSSFLYVLKTPAWSQADRNYFSSTQTVGLTLFGILGMAWTTGTNISQSSDYASAVWAVGVMIYARGAVGSDAELASTQLLQAFRGGRAAVALQVGAQAVCVAQVFGHGHCYYADDYRAERCNWIGSRWRNMDSLYASNLARYLPDASESEHATLFGSIISIAALDPSDPTRQGAINTYWDTMHVLIIIALFIGLIPIALAFLMPNYYLRDAQNTVDGLDIAGRKINDPQDPNHNREPSNERARERV